MAGKAQRISHKNLESLFSKPKILTFGNIEKHSGFETEKVQHTELSEKKNKEFFLIFISQR